MSTSDGPFVGSPQEFAEHVRRHRELHEMQAEDIGHRREEFLDGLSLEASEILLLILRTIAYGEEPAVIASYYEGVLRTHVKFRFKICLGCGKNHDELFANVTNGSSDVPENLEELMKEYRLARKDISDDNLTFDATVVVCIDCGLQYTSIKDRMMKPPGLDGCHGCQYKSGHG